MILNYKFEDNSSLLVNYYIFSNSSFTIEDAKFTDIFSQPKPSLVVMYSKQYDNNQKIILNFQKAYICTEVGVKDVIIFGLSQVTSEEIGLKQFLFENEREIYMTNREKHPSIIFEETDSELSRAQKTSRHKNISPSGSVLTYSSGVITMVSEESNVIPPNENLVVIKNNGCLRCFLL